MGSFSLIHWVIVLVIILLLFGAGRVSEIGKGLGEGIRNFKKGLKGDEDESDDPPLKRSKVIDTDVEVAPKQLTPGTGKKKKVIQIEVDDDDDAEELARKIV